MGDSGKGFTYCLGLFLMHANYDTTLERPHLGFLEAIDHLADLQIPDLPIKDRVQAFKDRCLLLRSPARFKDVEFDDIEWAFNEALAILRIYDGLNQIETKEAKIK